MKVQSESGIDSECDRNEWNARLKLKMNKVKKELKLKEKIESVR